MAANDSGGPAPRPTAGRRVKQAALFLLFGAILVIPRIRRLRRRVRVWTCLRLTAALGGGWLLWRFIHTRAGGPALAAGLLLLAFSLLVRAKPLAKSVDALARELSALIVLNGGVFRPSPDSTPIARVQIFLHPEQILVVGPGGRQLLQIPLAKVSSLAAYPMNDGAGTGPAAWEVKIQWVSNVTCTSTFRYDGTFAEHLARVTESTLRSQWMKDLPVIQA